MSAEGHDQHEQIEDPHVAIQVEGAFDLREIVGADERLLIREQRRDHRDAGQIQTAERRHER